MSSLDFVAVCMWSEGIGFGVWTVLEVDLLHGWAGLTTGLGAFHLNQHERL